MTTMISLCYLKLTTGNKQTNLGGNHMEQEFVIRELLEASKRLLHIELNPEEANALLSISQIRIYQKGDTVWGMNEKLSYVGLVLKGIVRSYYLDINGYEITKNFHRKHFLFMDEGLLDYHESICAYESITDSVIMLFDTEKLNALIKSTEKFKDIYIAALEQGMRYKIHRESEFLMNNATERYLQFKKNYPELVNEVKQPYISTYLGITPESLSRIRKALKDGTHTKGETYD